MADEQWGPATRQQAGAANVGVDTAREERDTVVRSKRLSTLTRRVSGFGRVMKSDREAI
jgi:hypothetical protein